MDLESQLISLISQLLFSPGILHRLSCMNFTAISVITQIISLVRSIDLNSQPKPESELMSLVTQTISFFNSMNLESQPKKLQGLISLISHEISLASSTDSYSFWMGNPMLLFEEISDLERELELISLMHKVFSLVVSISSKSGKFISLCPQILVESKGGKFYVCEKGICSSNIKWSCLPNNWFKFKFREEDVIHFRCQGCNGKNHEECKQIPVEIKHHLHRKHSLQLVLLAALHKTRKCYCCDEDLLQVFYYCLLCDFAMNVACVKKPPILSIDHPKWHEHSLALFPRYVSLTCDLCAVADSTPSPVYMCPPCHFVVHPRCTNLPRVIRISRHYHRISFTPSFHQGDLHCGVCRKNIDNYYGGYSCIKDGCSYAAHSRCATQRNVWDGKELEGELEEEIDEIEPFVRISDGIIQHFSHQYHHLKLNENTGRDYDSNKDCQACITPIYFGNFYFCMQCDFILHEKCANLPRTIYHPIHPHMLTLGYINVVDDDYTCAACPWLCTPGLFYECEEECEFKLHIRCAIISEPLVHKSHMHNSLFLTSKPMEKRICSVCKGCSYDMEVRTNETFNCIKECDFALCFGCATLPQKVRYKHDKHMLTLSYEKETSTMTYWCEVCEGKVNPEQGFYKCDEYCCVILHLQCLLGKDLYMKPGSLTNDLVVLPNNHMSRPVCSTCKKRCPDKIILQWSGSIFCSNYCVKCRQHELFRLLIRKKNLGSILSQSLSYGSFFRI